MVRSLRDVRLHLVHWGLRAAIRTHARPGDRLVRLGSQLCGWWVPAGLVRPGATAFCVGAGEDISFDLALLERGCEVWSFDPTPRAVEHVRSLAIESERFHFEPVGLWSHDGSVEFYESLPQFPSPTDSIVNLYGAETSRSLPVKRLRTMLEDSGRDSIDVCKIDVEGAEYEAIDSLLGDGVRPRALLVEFDQPQPPRRTIAAVRRLERAGYRLARIDFFNYTFLIDETTRLAPPSGG